METEVLVIIITVIGNILITLISIFANVHITKINNIDKLHEFKRHLTRYEIAAKPNQWIIDTVEDIEALSRYDALTKAGIRRRYKAINGKIKEVQEARLREVALVATAAQGRTTVNGLPDNSTFEVDDK